MKLLTAAAVMAALTAPAVAWDSDPASFRADPQAWVRNVLMPACKSPSSQDAALCACAVPVLAASITEADVSRVNEPDFAKGAAAKLVGVALVCKNSAPAGQLSK